MGIVCVLSVCNVVIYVGGILSNVSFYISFNFNNYSMSW